MIKFKSLWYIEAKVILCSYYDFLFLPSFYILKAKNIPIPLLQQVNDLSSHKFLFSYNGHFQVAFCLSIPNKLFLLHENEYNLNEHFIFTRKQKTTQKQGIVTGVSYTITLNPVMFLSPSQACQNVLIHL